MFNNNGCQYAWKYASALLRKLFLSGITALALYTEFSQAAAIDTVANRPVPGLQIKPARIAAAAQTAMILASATAGERLVAVGERGVIMLSDDAGQSFRQAKSVPISATLTSVHFIDAKNGWVAGHWGAILKTADAGETWQLQRSDVKVDQPIFSIYFQDGQTGWAVGLWSLILKTTDGGISWHSVALPLPSGESKADRNLYSIFPDNQGGLAITAERGAILRSADKGESWIYTDTAYRGSLWAGKVLRDGTWLVGGLRGTILRSTDHGKTWQSSQTGSKSSITGILQEGTGIITAYGLDGVLLTSKDGGATFSTTQRKDQASITTAIISPGGKLIKFSASGLLKD
ncbi:WD40/YVTN/BNR-like repeat-containing protein [Undibacterium sp. RuTC16W]|uniref:WD40/YVTN/BNR-like repeat-containing protein n=1 Tax=Undibacterium sp. RuTC16W TaxID=3413048 RepID=UPI003BF07D0F